MKEEHQLVSIIPELRTKRITYDISDGGLPPAVDEYLVTVTGKPGAYKPGTVYQVASVRLVKPNKPRPFNRWELTAFVTPDMIEHTHMNVHHGYAWVKDVNAHPIFWYSRNKKNK